MKGYFRFLFVSLLLLSLTAVVYAANASPPVKDAIGLHIDYDVGSPMILDNFQTMAKIEYEYTLFARGELAVFGPGVFQHKLAVNSVPILLKLSQKTPQLSHYTQIGYSLWN